MDYHLAPEGWTPEDANPFTLDGAYGSGWSCFRVLDSEDRIGRNNREANGLYTFIVGRDWSLQGGLAPLLADFLRYESLHGRNCLLSLPTDFGGAAFVERVLAETPAWSFVRPYDPKWMVHSTTAQGWVAIRSCGELRSLARLRREGTAAAGGVGLAQFREPEDYAEYVMLAHPGAMAPEFVVASQDAGTVITQEDTPYQPGARLFFDGHRLIREGLIVRDGWHSAKVYDHLPLDPYLIAAVTPADLDPAGEAPAWTPRTFCLAALEHFSRVVGEPVPYAHWC